MSAVTPWSVAIIACRETLPTLARCVLAAQAAAGRHPTIIDVLVNGNDRLAHETAAAAASWQTECSKVRIWKIEQGDKAHAWNEYVHRIWQPGSIAFFLDAYAEAQAGAFPMLAEALSNKPDALAATAVPTAGRSAAWLRAKMLRKGGFHGNMHLLGVRAMTWARTSGFRLPLGLYRTDSLVNAVLNFNLDPVHNKWDTSRVAVVGTASWNVQDIARLTPANIIGQLKRKVRQARGVLENLAVREHLAVRRQPPESLPQSAYELVSSWLHDHRSEARAIFVRSPLTYYAARQFRTSRDWSACQKAPVCLNCSTSLSSEGVVPDVPQRPGGVPRA